MSVDNILFCMRDFTGGGAERVCIDIANNLDRSRFQPVVLVCTVNGPLFKQLEPDVVVVEIGDKLGLRKSRQFRRSVLRVLAEYEPAIIHSHLTMINRHLIRAIKYTDYVDRLIITEHNNLELNINRESSRLKRWLVSREIRNLYRYPKLITTVSDGVKANLVDFLQLEKKRVRVIYNPVAIDKINQKILQPIDAKTQILMSKAPTKAVAMGRLVNQKGYPDLVSAFKKIRIQHDAHLFILGAGPMEGELKALVSRLELNSYVHFMGFTSNPWNIISKCDLFLSMSRWEGFYLAGIEAMACGVPVVVTDCDFGPREVIENGKDGVLIEVNNEREFVKQACKVLNDKDYSSGLLKRALDKAAKFNVEKIVKNYQDVYQSTISSNKW